MVNKNVIIAIVLIIIAVALIGFGTVMILEDLGVNGDNDNLSEKLFIVELENAYGVIDANSNIIAKPQFSKISRINNIIYLKSNNASYIYNLTSKKTLTLDGYETDIHYIKTEDGFLDKYILQYGSTDNDSIYRIIDETGTKVSNKDFASINSVYSYLELTEPDNFTPKAIQNTTLNKSDVVATLSYPSQDGNSQYITKTINNGVIKYGIVDEYNKQIVEPTFDNIEQIKDSNKACIAKKGDLEYVILDNGTFIETETGFEFDYSDEGYVIQKRGATGNKIYNLNGDVIVDQIFTYPAQIVTLNGVNVNYLLMQSEKSGLWNIYNMDTAEKLKAEFSNIVVDYLYNKDINVINTTFIYRTSSSVVGVDLETFETFNIKNSYSIVCPLESGTKIDIVDKLE